MPVATLVLMYAAVAVAEQGYDFVACNARAAHDDRAGSDTVAWWRPGVGHRQQQHDQVLGRRQHGTGSSRITQGRPVGKGTCKWLTAGGSAGDFEYSASGEPSWVLGQQVPARQRASRAAAPSASCSRPSSASEGTSQVCHARLGRYTTP